MKTTSGIVCTFFGQIRYHVTGKKNPYTTLLQRGNFLSRKKWGQQRKISVVDVLALIFNRFCIYHRCGEFSK